MQISLFRALQSIRIADDRATTVVERLESHVESVVQNNIVKVENNLAKVEGELVGIKATLDALKMQMTFMTTLLAVIGLAIAAAPILAKLIR